MLKQVLFFGLMCYAFATKAQLPKLISNTTTYHIERSPVYKQFSGKYDFLIAHQYSGGWSNAVFSYNIIAFKGNKRYKIDFWQLKETSDTPEPEIKLTIRSLKKRTADSILAVFNENNFWGLSKDSLSYYKYTYYDEDLRKYIAGSTYISDGLNDIFEIQSKDAFMIVSCYEPEAHFKKMPQIKQRGRFINAKRAFLAVFPDVWQPPVDK